MAKSKSKRASKSRVNNKKVWQVILIILSSIVVVMTAVYIVGGIIVDEKLINVRLAIRQNKLT